MEFGREFFAAPGIIEPAGSIGPDLPGLIAPTNKKIQFFTLASGENFRVF